MEFIITTQASIKIKKESFIINQIKEDLNTYFSGIEYTENLETLYFGFFCLEDYTLYDSISNIKYYKSKKSLELNFFYKIDEIKNKSSKYLESLIINSLNQSSSLIAKKILNFNIHDFKLDLDHYSNYKISKQLRDHNKKSKLDKPYNENCFNQIIPEYSDRINEALFWDLIEQSRNQNNQIIYLTNQLSFYEEYQIVEFEFTFRKILLEGLHYNTLAIAKIILGLVSDDSYLYFLCHLIFEGKNVYYNAIKEPDSYAQIVDVNSDFDKESLLKVADNAFLRKINENIDKELPSDLALSYLDYNLFQALKGKNWVSKDLPKMYPKLWQKFNEKK